MFGLLDKIQALHLQIILSYYIPKLTAIDK